MLLEGRSGGYESTLKQYQAKADYFACACLQKNDGYNINKTPGEYKYYDTNFYMYFETKRYQTNLKKRKDESNFY